MSRAHSVLFWFACCAAGCFSLTPDSGRYSCRPSGPPCDDGYFCASDNRCYANGTDLAAPDLSSSNDDLATPIDQSGGDGDDAKSGVSFSRSAIELAPAAPLANGQSQVTITVTVRDDSGAPLPGLAVTLSSTGSGNTLTQPVGPTAQDGTVLGGMASTVAETKTVSAIVGGVTLTSDVQFVAPVPGSVFFSVQPPNAGPGQILNPPVRVTVRDADMVSLPGASVSVTLANNTSGATLGGGTTASTDASGTAVFSTLEVDIAQAGYHLVATAGSQMATSAQFNVVAGLPNPPGGVTATASASSITVSWGAVGGATGYNLLRSTVSGNEVQIASNVSGTNFVDSHLLRGAYYYEVETVNSVGSSIPSLEVTASAEVEACVANYAGNSLVVVAGGHDGSVTALRSVSMGVSSPFAVAVDPVNSEIFVANLSNGKVQVFDRIADGTDTPKRTISGFVNPSALVVDPVAGELYVANFGNNTVAVYDHNATDPATAKRTNSSTSLHGPQGLALDKANNELWVSNDGNDSLTVFATSASGAASPARTAISGSNTGLNSVANIAYDTTDSLVIAVNQGAVSASAFDRTATGNALPHWIIQGASTGLAMPSSVAFDPVPAGGGEIWVTNSSSVTVYGARHGACGSPCTPLNLVPSRTITSTAFSGPNGVAVCN